MSFVERRIPGNDVKQKFQQTAFGWLFAQRNAMPGVHDRVNSKEKSD